MPTYEYACKACGEHVDVVQSFKEDPLTECPACGGPLRKVFSPIGIAFKGSGFYRTDSRTSTSKTRSDKRSESAPASSESASSPPAEKRPEKRAEKKPEAKRGAAAS